MSLSRDTSASSHEAAGSAVDGSAEGTNSAQGTDQALRRAQPGVSREEKKGPQRTGKWTRYLRTEPRALSLFTSSLLLAFGACLLALSLMITSAAAGAENHVAPAPTTTLTGKSSSPPRSEEASSDGFRLTTVHLGVGTVVIAFLMFVIARRTLQINRLTLQINQAKEDREREAQQHEDPSFRLKIQREADASLDYLKATLAKIIGNVMELSEDHAKVDRDEKHSLVLDEYFFSLPLIQERYSTLLEELLSNGAWAARYTEEIRSRLPTLSKTNWRLNDFDVPSVLEHVDELTRRLNHPENLFPSEASRLAASAYNEVAALLS